MIKYVVRTSFVAAITLLLLGSLPAGATTIGYQATSGGNAPAQAIFTTSANTITITMVNNDVNPTADSENVTALIFQVSNGNSGTTLSSSSGLERTITSNTDPFTDGATVPTGWVLTAPGVKLQLDVLSGPSHAGPEHTLLGKPDPADPTRYTNANGSLTNGSHNPFLANTIMFTIDFPGVTAATTILNATFQFGTVDGSNQVPGTPFTPSVPEPASLVMAGLGLAAVLGCRVVQRRRSGSSAA